jgi:hypothetical protein
VRSRGAYSREVHRASIAEGSRPRSGRVGLACPRFTAFDPMLGDERVARLRERHALLAAALEADLGSEIVDAGGLETAEDVAAARRLLDAADVDVSSSRPPWPPRRISDWRSSRACARPS